ncbi:hypothetical protein ACFW04_014881 [Cataglyphis niger]
MCNTICDLMFAVSIVSRYLTELTIEHSVAVKRVIRYAKETAAYSILYDGKNTDRLVTYIDADYAGNINTRCSTRGYVAVLAGGAISWCSKHQSVTALLICEAELMARALRRLSRLFESALKLVKNPEAHKRTKHIDVKFHFVREVYENRQVIVDYVPTSQQLADFLIKGLTKINFKRNRDGLQICLVSTKFVTSGCVGLCGHEFDTDESKNICY